MYMRDLTFLETGYVCFGLVLSLVLPLLLSFRAPQDPAARKSATRTVWLGQFSLALAGVVILASPVSTPFAAILGCVAWLTCLVRLRRQLGLFSRVG